MIINFGGRMVYESVICTNCGVELREHLKDSGRKQGCLCSNKASIKVEDGALIVGANNISNILILRENGMYEAPQL